MFRPLRKKSNAIDDAAVRELLAHERRGVLAVAGDDGYPYAVPVNYFYDADAGKIPPPENNGLSAAASGLFRQRTMPRHAWCGGAGKRSSLRRSRNSCSPTRTSCATRKA